MGHSLWRTVSGGPDQTHWSSYTVSVTVKWIVQSNLFRDVGVKTSDVTPRKILPGTKGRRP